ncbi:MAG: GHKL domain-containing protein [Erysipelotrichia bacterium]|nr:GHKL domain-containing protein [Erysipelotrichia bacterium]NCC54817.1 GHKL domain-containing protein [Erysipelotrichia bacterium]
MENLNIFYGIIEECFNIINQILIMLVLKQCIVKVNSNRSFITFLMLSLSFLLGKVFESHIFTIVLNMMIQFVFFMKTVDLRGKERYVYFIFTLTLETFFVSILKLVSKKLFYLSGTYNLNSMVINIFLFSMIAIVFRYKKNKNENDANNRNYYPYLFLTIGFISSLLVILIVYLFGHKFSNEMNIMLLLLAFITILANITIYVFYNRKHIENIKQKTELVSMEHVLRIQEKYFQDTVASYDDLRKFRHDINGYFNVIDDLMLNEKYDELQSLTKNLKNEMKRNSQINCNNIYVSATLNQFLHILKEQNIKFAFRYDVLKEITTENHHLCSLIYNLMSNAVDGCMKCSDNREIDLRIHQKNKALIIQVTNNVDDSFTLSSLKEGNSSKKNRQNHGLGIKNINCIVKKYNGNITFQLIGNKLEASIVLLHCIEEV